MHIIHDEKLYFLWKDGELRGNIHTADSEFRIILWYYRM